MKLLKLFYPNTGFLSFAIYIAINYAFSTLLVAFCCTTTVGVGRKRAFPHEIKRKV